MDIITLDFETYWAKDFTLSKMTTQEYILDYRFDCILVGWQVNDGSKQWITGTMDQIKRELQELDWGNSALLCQNTMFDGAILAWHMGIKPLAYLDTLAMSRALYPHEKSHSLAKQAERAGLQAKGTEVVNAQGKYRHDFTGEELEKYAEYCLNDCDLTYKLAMRYLPRMKKAELKLIDSTLRMYIDPQFEVDLDVLEAHLEQVVADKQALLTTVLTLCGNPGAATEDLRHLLASNAKFAEALEFMGVEPPMKLSPTTGNMAYAFAKTDEAFKGLEDHEDPRVQALIAARLGTKSTIEESRTERLIKCASLAREVPIALRYYGAWCVTGDVEVMTRQGWVPLHEWSGGEIVQYNSDTGGMSFLPATRYVGPVCSDWINVESPYVKASFTKGHTFPKFLRGSRKFTTIKAGDLATLGSVLTPVSGEFNTGAETYSSAQLRMFVAIQADGHYEEEAGGARLKFRFNKPRKVERLLALISELGITNASVSNFPSEPNTTTIRIPLKEYAWLLGRKQFRWEYLDSPQSSLRTMLNEFQFWDGWVQGGQVYFCSTNKCSVDFFSSLAHMVGCAAKVTCKAGLRGRLALWSAAVRTRDFCEIKTKAHVKESNAPQTPYCAETQTGFWLARSKGLVFVTGNTGRWSADSSGATNFQNMPRKSTMKKAIKAPQGYMICGADLSNIELRLALWLAGQWDKVELIRQGRDLYKDLASKTNGVNYDEVPDDMRQTYKVVNLSAVYATGGARLKETLRIMAKQKVPLEDAKRMIYAYRDENDKVVEAWQACQEVMAAITTKATHIPTLFRGLVSWDPVVQGFLLPSGLHLQMPNLRIEYNEKGRPEFVFDGAYGPERTYGGKLFQGLTQALARCVIGTGWLRIEKRHRVGLSVHDSLYWIVKEHLAKESFEWGVEQMTQPISWCPDLPLAAEGGFGRTLGDIK